MIRRATREHRHPTGRSGLLRPIRRLLPVLLVVPLLVGGLGTPARTNGDELSDALARQKALAAKVAAQKKQVAKLNAQQGGLRSEIAATSKALTGVNADLAAVKKRIGKLADDIDAVMATYDGLVERMNQLDEQFLAVQAAENRKVGELHERKNVLAEHLRAAYRTEQTSLLETFLSGDSFSDIVADVGYMLDFSRQDKALAEQIVRDQQTLAALHQTVVDTRVETDALRVETAHQRRALADRLADLESAREQLKALEEETERQLAIQKAAYAKLARNKSALAKAIAQNQASQAALKKRIDTLVRQQAQRGNIPSVYNGSMIWPMAGSITQEYGCTGFGMEPRRGSCAHWHTGIDIATDAYTPIRSAADGTVIFAGPNPYDPYPKAWIVIVAHSQNLLTWYGHVDNARYPPPVRAGEFVRQGEVIAYEGNTGRSTGFHLHWMIELNNDFVNPRLFL